MIFLGKYSERIRSTRAHVTRVRRMALERQRDRQNPSISVSSNKLSALKMTACVHDIEVGSEFRRLRLLFPSK